MKTLAEHIAEAGQFWQGQIKTFLESEGMGAPDPAQIKQEYENALATGQIDMFVQQYGLDQADKLASAATRADGGA